MERLLSKAPRESGNATEKAHEMSRRTILR
jgi:hypothetical protein